MHKNRFEVKWLFM